VPPATGRPEQLGTTDRPRRGFPAPWRLAAVPLAVLALVAVGALIGWQTGWPPAVFGTKLVSSAGSPRPSAASPSLQSPTTAAPSPTSPGSTATSPGSVASPAVAGPRGAAATVKAYFAAINRRAYAAAWRLGGKNTGQSYRAFVNGLSGTADDTVSIISVNGRTVTAQLTAQQSDGTIKTFQGTYTVTRGVIARFHVQQTS
jgi:hypothetical protein